MTDYSLNKWPVLDAGDPHLKTGVIPGTSRTITCHQWPLPLFLHFAAAWNAEMPSRLKLNKGPVDSWEVRQSRTGGGFSNHASATALDLRYDVLLADHQLHMTPVERGTLTKILARYTTADGHHVLANGYAWKPGSYADEMHTELSQGWDTGNGAKRYTTAADVAEVIHRLGIKSDGTSISVPASPVVPSVPVSPVVEKHIPTFPGPFGLGARGAHVKSIQVGLGIVVDGAFGPVTLAAVKRFQRVRPWLWPADGVVGPRTYSSLAKPV